MVGGGSHKPNRGILPSRRQALCCSLAVPSPLHQAAQRRLCPRGWGGAVVLGVFGLAGAQAVGIMTWRC